MRWRGDLGRRVLVVGVCATLLASAFVLGVRAGSGSSSGALNRQSFAMTSQEATTSSMSFEDVPGLQVNTGCHRNRRVAAQLSLELAQGAGPVEIRVVMDDPLVVGESDKPMKPGPVTIDTGVGAGTQSFSFLFAARKAVGDHGTEFRAQWRSPSGTPVGLESGTLHVLWHKLKNPCL